MKIFKRSVWTLITGFFAIMLAICIVGGSIANQYSANINSILGIDPYEKVTLEGDEDSEYYKSSYIKRDGDGNPLYVTDENGYRHQVYDNEAMRKNSLEIARQVATEGSVLLWNNAALPLANEAKVSFFGVSTVDYLYSANGSGHIGVTMTETLKTVCESKDRDIRLQVNSKLFNAYKLCKAGYGGRGQRTDNVDDANYCEWKVGEIAWENLDKTALGQVTDTIASYNDAGIMIISRNAGECQDTDYYTDECLDNSYMDLSHEEAEVLGELKKLKEAGTLKKIVLLINSPNAVQFKNIRNYGIDACVWVGTGGNASLDQIADILTGAENPSGHLTDTYVYDNDSAPATENSGDYTFTEYAGTPSTQTYTWNSKYVVYQEGIYVGYRYYETRYEDSVIGGRNANNSAAGVKAGTGNWDYNAEVAYPFGYGTSYTTFEYSGFNVKKTQTGYDVEVTVKNTGSVAGKDAVQVYLQKPYTDYDKANKIEKAAVELVGYAKTDKLEPNGEQKVTVSVDKESFKTYDAYGKGTYILEKGTYYLATGSDSHDALNNILNKKGYTQANGMDAAGDGRFVEEISVLNDDYTTYATSSATGYPIKNQFDNADVNLYEGTKGQEITYLSRSDWNGTYPSAVTLTCTSTTMIADMQYGYDPEVEEGAEMPVMGETTSEYGELTLAMLKDLEYKDSQWEDLLNQLTWEEMSMLCTYGSNAFAGAASVAAPGCKSKDGPGGIGITNPDLTSLMAFPCEVLMSATFNDALVEELGKAFGLEILHVGYTCIYGPGANIHRSAYSGRNWEYYSEDGFISGKMLAAEVRGLQSNGVIVTAKHFALNDQERNRYGGTVWANEQSIREIYLKAFEAGVTEGNMNGLMSSFNRIGCTWSGKHRGLLTEVLRNEWGFIGIVESDAGVGTHMMDFRAMAQGVVAGNDVWMSGGSESAFDAYRNNPTVALAMRESAHRMLYTQLHSGAMNGTSANTRIVKITPWWVSAITTASVIVGVVTGLCALMAVASFVLTARQQQKETEK